MILFYSILLYSILNLYELQKGLCYPAWFENDTQAHCHKFIYLSIFLHLIFKYLILIFCYKFSLFKC